MLMLTTIAQRQTQDASFIQEQQLHDKQLLKTIALHILFTHTVKSSKFLESESLGS